MDIKSLEINLFKASEINNGDILLVKIDENKRKSLQKEDVQSLYKQIKQITKKDISIYFFPKDLSIHIIKTRIKNIEDSKESILKNEESLGKNS